MIELFEIFGSAAIAEKLVQTHAIARQAAETAPKGRRRAFTTAMAIVSVVLGGIVYADGVVSAIENFYTRVNTTAEVLQLANPSAPKLLPAPSPSISDTQSDEQTTDADEQVRA
ncbi:hypothetical protein [Rhizobium sp. BK176]|uniref:hypothetical protein n=1 Tax=Rhizobium sp. BK176 TaxID=2587071 RepID=UPI002168A4D0|nr:hypothetical protein [Rhizobium sp. BK176]MCS4096107.1 hypothetical protein [Rhizobium sp. BK176]